MATSCSYSMPFPVSCSIKRKPLISDSFGYLRVTLASAFTPILRGLHQAHLQFDVSKTIRYTTVKLLDAFVDSVYEFSDHPLLPSQSNLAPVDELGEAMLVTSLIGKIPDDFSQGIYIRNGPNPLFGGLKSTKSIFGRSSHIWVEGEGMLHALYFKKESDGSWTVVYNNRHVETETYKLEKQRNKPSFLPAIEGDSPAILLAYLLNLLRFGKVNKYISNTNVFEHSGKYYSVAENHIPQEIDILTLKTLRNWDVSGAWNRPFTSHPKRAPGTGELVIMGTDATKPFLEVGIVSADGKKLVHKVDLKLNRGSLCHDLGVTERYTVIIDFPLTIDINRLLKGGPLIKYDKEGYARIGIMPRYGDADSVQWFQVEPNCTFHIINSFEDADEVVLWGCRALDSLIPGTDLGVNIFKCFSHCYEWRLNMKTGDVKERNLTGTEFSMDFPVINGNFTGLKNKYGYTQVVNSTVSSSSGIPNFGGLAKLYFEEQHMEFPSGNKPHKELIKVEYHMFEKNVFCTGSTFVSKEKGVDEDDGWILTFVHNENTSISQVYIIDTKMFSSEPVATISLPRRVPYGFHGAFMPISL
ncbi:carotenoid 9,10(9',10')-cleavage dioxygenase 1-like [Quillaja saponaria]|uniref:Carotenoid 9,10(9',10')-cleavage dioxygenase 1-like n=1 Tax=Quillaja saponaria TaxID=32244 RepID=A0AAD7LI20_QUISA|nr:carotenoid 9,10(9',10')-cleavage dioxygenase 1-like [Quillaja saponaria]